jgi:DNA-binding MarR family transcriptional regulator
MLHILRCLNRVDSKVNQQELANLTFKDKSSLSYLIKNMEKRGLLARKEDPSDKRNKLVALTAKGEKLYAEIREIIDDVYAKLEENVNLEHIQRCVEYMKEFTDINKES